MLVLGFVLKEVLIIFYLLKILDLFSLNLIIKTARFLLPLRQKATFELLQLAETKHLASEVDPVLRIVVFHYVDVTFVAKHFKQILSSINSHEVPIPANIRLFALPSRCPWHL